MDPGGRGDNRGRQCASRAVIDLVRAKTSASGKARTVTTSRHRCGVRSASAAPRSEPAVGAGLQSELLRQFARGDLFRRVDQLRAVVRAAGADDFGKRVRERKGIGQSLRSSRQRSRCQPRRAPIRVRASSIAGPCAPHGVAIDLTGPRRSPYPPGSFSPAAKRPSAMPRSILSATASRHSATPEAVSCMPRGGSAGHLEKSSFVTKQSRIYRG